MLPPFRGKTMRKNSIRLSEQHGVNPSLMQCFVCGEDVGVALLGKLPGDEQAPHRICFGPNDEPCDKCKDHMKMGIILISVRDGEEGDNPYRTGGWCVVREEAIKRWLEEGDNEELLTDILKRRMAFLPDEVWDMIGLPRGETNE
jgi:hypothetical protein